MSLNSKSIRSIRLWLLVSTLFILLMVAVGGLTRLTRSGLSIVEWKPVTGVLPPLNEEQWLQEFNKYRQTPQYQKINKGMALEDFQFIYFWEYGHRLLGRVIGFVFVLPFLWFLWQRKLSSSLKKKLGIAFLIGGFQGFLGWFMVKSGLVDRPSVSHFRLAAHLLVALFLMGFLYWIFLDLKSPYRRTLQLQNWKKLSWLFVGLLSLQIFYGALTAGLQAGHMYNTFPTMNGLWIPQNLGSMGWFLDFLENPVTVQFVHRILGTLVLLFSFTLAWKSSRSRELNARQRWSFYLLAGMTSLQFLLGVITLLWIVPIALGSLHQIGACLLLLLSINALHAVREQASSSYLNPVVN